MRTERPEPILPARNLDETRALYERLGFAPWFRGRHLPSDGIPRLTAPVDQPWGLREFTLVDPSGNLVRVGHDLGDAYIPRDS